MRVVIAEDLALLRDGLTRLLRDNGFEVVAAVGDGDALVHAVRSNGPTSRSSTSACRPASATRASAPRSSCAARARRRRSSSSRSTSSTTYATELLADGRGGVGYLLKDRIMDVDDFVDAVRRVAEGGTALDPEVVAQLFSRRGARRPARAAHAARARGARR